MSGMPASLQALRGPACRRPRQLASLFALAVAPLQAYHHPGCRALSNRPSPSWSAVRGMQRSTGLGRHTCNARWPPSRWALLASVAQQICFWHRLRAVWQALLGLVGLSLPTKCRQRTLAVPQGGLAAARQVSRLQHSRCVEHSRVGVAATSHGHSCRRRLLVTGLQVRGCATLRLAAVSATSADAPAQMPWSEVLAGLLLLGCAAPPPCCICCVGQPAAALQPHTAPLHCNHTGALAVQVELQQHFTAASCTCCRLSYSSTSQPPVCMHGLCR